MIPIVLVLKPKFPRSKREIFMLTVAGLMGSSINLGLTFYGFDMTTVLDVTVIGNTGPIFVVAAGAIFLKEKVTKREIAGILITFLGTLIVVAEPLFKYGLFNLESLYGNILIVIANITWVVYIVISKKELHHKIDILLMTTYMFVLGFFSTLPFALIQTNGIVNLLILVSTAPFIAHLGVWYMAVLSGSLAYFLYQEGQKKIEVSEATLFGYLSPLFAAPLAVFWLKEKVTLPFIIGTTVIIAGVFVAEYRKSTRH